MISVIIPTYNERENILPLLERLRGELSKKDVPYEIIVIDDNSPDKTAQLVKNTHVHSSNIRVFVRSSARGLSTAILFGIKKSKGDIIVGMDADFNHPPELILQLIEQLDTAHLAVASRFIKGGGMDERGRYLGTYFFNLFLKKILGFPTMDNMSGYYGMKKEDLLKFNLTDVYRGHGEYHIRLLWSAKKLKMKIVEVPVHYKKRKYGKSKSNLFQMLISYTLCALKLRLKDTPPVVV